MFEFGYKFLSFTVEYVDNAMIACRDDEATALCEEYLVRRRWVVAILPPGGVMPKMRDLLFVPPVKVIRALPTDDKIESVGLATKAYIGSTTGLI